MLKYKIAISFGEVVGAGVRAANFQNVKIEVPIKGWGLKNIHAHEKHTGIENVQLHEHEIGRYLLLMGQFLMPCSLLP
jgi:hypothetical protein